VVRRGFSRGYQLADQRYRPVMTHFLPGLLLLFLAARATAATPFATCIEQHEMIRVARVLDPAGQAVYARVVEQHEGRITRAATIASTATPLSIVFEKAGAMSSDAYAVSDKRVCGVVDLAESDIDAETHVVVSTGLNYAAHADEAGGGDVFLFPKPVTPTSPYAKVHAPAGVLLFDYEVELAFVLLADIDLANPPAREELLANSVFFLSNDISDREAIIRNASLSGPGTGFVEAKGQRGFMPAGPWMVRGTELFEAIEACGGTGLRLRLWVDSGEGDELRQDANTELMILQPDELVSYLYSWIKEHGLRTPMPFDRDGTERFYPLAVGSAGAPRFPAGSIFQTGTPEGVALNAPSPVGVTLRGLLRLRGPFSQFLVEERARVAEGGTNYLAPGHRVRAQITGLGTQQFEIGETGGSPSRDACVQ
jgi:2-keto-4-pentenoate hydratase/2-oxohepta-3-ene-1,7-dioic acid hydratase in catechol pathway